MSCSHRARRRRPPRSPRSPDSFSAEPVSTISWRPAGRRPRASRQRARARRQIEHDIDVCAVATRLQAARRRLSHRRGPTIVSLIATDPEGPRPTSSGPTRADPIHHRELRRAHIGWSIVGAFGSEAWSPPILKASTPLPLDQHALAARTQHARIRSAEKVAALSKSAGKSRDRRLSV